MKHVEILNDKKQVLKRFPKLNTGTKSLTKECEVFGPGKYYARWPIAKNQGDGKERKKEYITREVYVYNPDGSVLPMIPAMNDRSGGVQIINPAPQGAINAETLRSVLADVLQPIHARLEAVEQSGFDDEEEEDEEETSEVESDLWSKLINIARKPRYVPLLVPLLSVSTDDQKFQAIEAAFSADPTLKHEIFMDFLSLIPSDFLPGVN